MMMKNLRIICLILKFFLWVDLCVYPVYEDNHRGLPLRRNLWIITIIKNIITIILGHLNKLQTS